MQTLNIDNNCFSDTDNVIVKQALQILRDIPSGSVVRDLARENVRRSQQFLETLNSVQFTVAHYAQEEQIVCLGNLVRDKFRKNEPDMYAPVPLGIIISGEVLVLKEGKTTKRLLPGDFIGLFETANYLHLNSIRRIGNWTLTADTNTTVLFFLQMPAYRENNKESFASFQNYLVDISRNDPVPQPITDLPLLDWTSAKVTKCLLDNTFIIAHTHILPTSLALFRQLAHLVGYQNMLVMEKPYSTVRTAADSLVKMGVEFVPVIMTEGAPYDFAVKRSVEVLWDKVINIQKRRNIKRILILDDGGDLYLSIPWDRLVSIEVAGVEQTQRGISRLETAAQNLPTIVNVAGSAVKKNIESVFIGQSIVDKLKSLGLLDNFPRAGVVGVGSIGRAVANELRKAGIEVIIYDIDCHIQSVNGAQSMTSIDAVINKVDLVIGCTGEDCLKGIALDRIEGRKIFISATSADVEFFSLLNLVSFRNHNFDTVLVEPHPNLEIRLLNGGYPINFDRERAWVAAEDIQITRSLLYAGLMQSLDNSETIGAGLVELNSEIQKEIVRKWRQLKREDDTLAEHLLEITNL